MVKRVVQAVMTQRDHVEAAMKRVGGRGPFPRNRAEARQMLRANGPWMRFRYEEVEVDGEKVRLAVRVRV